MFTGTIEEKIRSIGEVDKIKNSTSRAGECRIHVTIKDDAPAEQLPATWKLLRTCAPTSRTSGKDRVSGTSLWPVLR